MNNKAASLHTVFLLLGSNVGNRKKHIQNGIGALADEVGNVIEISSLYETAPWNAPGQHDYLNAAVIMQTGLQPLALLHELKRIEAGEGRMLPAKYAPRTLDIDIIFYDDLIIESPPLTIPHPLLPKRRFALMPLNEIAPGKFHPLHKRSITELLTVCDDPLPVKKVGRCC